MELLRLEERGSTAGQQRSSQPNTPHHQSHQVHGSPGSGNQQQQPANEQAQDVFEVEELFGNEEATANSRKSVSPVQCSDAEHLHLTAITPTPPKTQSFISRLFKFSSSKSTSRNQSLSPSTYVYNKTFRTKVLWHPLFPSTDQQQATSPSAAAAMTPPQH